MTDPCAGRIGGMLHLSTSRVYFILCDFVLLIIDLYNNAIEFQGMFSKGIAFSTLSQIDYLHSKCRAICRDLVGQF